MNKEERKEASIDCVNCARLSGTAKPYSRKVYGDIVEQCPQCGDPWYELRVRVVKTLNESWYADLADETYFAVMNQREDILRAFIAQYGCRPDEAEQVEERIDGQIVYSVRPRAIERSPDAFARLTRENGELKEELRSIEERFRQYRESHP